MKAVILDGGRATRLWPVAEEGSKAAAPLLGRPLLAWTAKRLKQAGVTEIILTLPATAEEPDLGTVCLPVTVLREAHPAGTAGALAALEGTLCRETFLLVSGDVLWDFNLEELMGQHRRRDAAATLALCHSDCPQRFGVAVAGRNGQILSFLEKPSLERCPATTVYAGIGAFSPQVFRWLEGAEDLGRDLFPRLAEAGALYGAPLQGWWRDVDTPEDLLNVTSEVLAGRCRDLLDEEPARVGVWSASPIPEDVELVPPCRIGAGVTLGRGCLIGPHVSLENGVTVGERCLIQRSVLQTGAAVGGWATIYGAVVGRNARLGCYTVLNEGTAAGPSAQVGDNAILMEGVRVGPGLSVPPSMRLTECVTGPVAPPAIRPEHVPELTVEDMLKLGRRLGRCGAVGAGGEGFRGLLLARAFGCGAAAAGAAVVLHDGTLPEQGAWLARYYGWPASVFADSSGGVYLFDSQGSPLTAPPPDGETGEGSWDHLAGTAAAWRAAMEREAERPEARAAFHNKKGLYFL